MRLLLFCYGMFCKRGCLLCPAWKRCSFQWQYPVNRHVTCLACILLSFKNSTDFLAEGLERKLFVFVLGWTESIPDVFCTSTPWACFITLSEMPQAVSASVNGINGFSIKKRGQWYAFLKSCPEHQFFSECKCSWKRVWEIFEHHELVFCVVT
jgi:hypothetical protein